MVSPSWPATFPRSQCPSFCAHDYQAVRDLIDFRDWNVFKPSILKPLCPVITSHTLLISRCWLTILKTVYTATRMCIRLAIRVLNLSISLNVIISEILYIRKAEKHT